MEFQIFILIWMLFIHKIHTKPNYKISADTPEVKICNDSPDPQPKWTIQVNLSVTKTELQSSQDPIRIYLITIAYQDKEICGTIIDDIRVGKCQPKLSNTPLATDEVFCYCASSGNDWYNLKVTGRSDYSYNGASLFIEFPIEAFDEKFPVTILSTTCFNFWPPDNGVIQTRTLNAGEIWNAFGYLDVAFVDLHGYGNLVKVKIGTLSFCNIDIRKCPPTQLPTGDIICYCSYKEIVPEIQMDRFDLNITATAKDSQSKAILTTEYGPVTETIGTLPKIKGQITPKSQGTNLPTIPQQSTTKIQRTNLPRIPKQSTTKSQGTNLPIIPKQSTIKSQGTNLPIISKQSTTKSQGTYLPIIPKQTTTKSQGTNLPIKTEQNTTEENRKNASSSNVWLKLLMFCLAGICTSVALLSFTRLHRKTERAKAVLVSSPIKYSSTKYSSTKYDSNSTETLSMEGTSVDPPSYGIHSKPPPASIDSNAYHSSVTYY